MSEEQTEVLITAFKSHLDLIASMPARNVKNNIEEAVSELIDLCKTLDVPEKQIYDHYKKLVT